MPKASKATASSHLAVPAYSDGFEQETGNWTVTSDSGFIRRADRVEESEHMRSSQHSGRPFVAMRSDR